MSFRNSIAVCLCSLLVATSGCKEKTKQAAETSRPFEGQKITVSVPAGLGFTDEWRNPLEEWAAETGGAYTLTEVDDWKGDKPASALLERSHGTLVLFPLSRLGEALAANAWAEIPESARRENNLDWLEVFGGLRDNVCSPNRAPHFVPLQVPVLVCYYREDLLKKANLSPPQTWEEYHELLLRLPEWAPGLTAVEPWCPEFRSTMFLARSAAYAKHEGHFSFLFDIETGEPEIGTPGFVRGLEQVAADLPLLSKSVQQLSPEDCRREFLSGRAAIALAYETGPDSRPALFGSTCTAPSPVDAKTKSSNGSAATSSRPEGLQIAFAPLPGAREAYNLSVHSWQRRSDKSINRAHLTGFAGLMAGVSAKTPAERDAAWNALSKLIRSEGASHFPPGTLGVTRQSDYESPRPFVGKSLTESEGRQYVNVVARCMQDSQLVLELPIPNREAYRKALANGVTQVMDGKQKPASALKQVADEWKAINHKTGMTVVRDQYCRGIGLKAP